MTEKLPIVRFFKVMMPGFHEKVSLPPAFCEQFKGEVMEKAVLKSSEGLWQIKVGKCCKGLLYFGEGWENFVKHHGLVVGDFVVFEHKGNMVFDVLMLDASSCEKEFQPIIDLTSERERSSGEDPLEEAKSFSPKGPHFIKTVTRSNGYRTKPYMHIPKDFAKANLHQRSMAILKDLSGKSWPVKIMSRITKQDGNVGKRAFIYTGWHEFYVGNKLKLGDVCLFELDLSRKTPDAILIDVHIFRK